MTANQDNSNNGGNGETERNDRYELTAGEQAHAEKLARAAADAINAAEDAAEEANSGGNSNAGHGDTLFDIKDDDGAQVDSGGNGGGGSGGGNGNDRPGGDDDDGDGDGDGDGDDHDDGDGTGDNGDDNYTNAFTAAPRIPGEFLARVGDLGGWDKHMRRFSPNRSTHSSALALSAADPMSFRPIVVIKKGGKLVVIDGRFILEEIKAAHPNNDDLEVRCVLFAGTECEAIAAMCDAGLGTAVATKMEKAHCLLSLQQAAGISQTALADRYEALTVHKVSQMLIAARLQDAYPDLYAMLETPHLTSINHGVTLSKAVKVLSPKELTDLLAHAKTFVDSGERCEPSEHFDKLGLPSPQSTSSLGVSKAKRIEASESEAIFGDDDEEVGAYERLADGIDRIRLPDTSTMSLQQREAAAEAFIAWIRRHFGLDQED